MTEEEQTLCAALDELGRELDRMMNEGQIEQANELVAAICARFAIETARIVCQLGAPQGQRRLPSNQHPE